MQSTGGKTVVAGEDGGAGIEVECEFESKFECTFTFKFRFIQFNPKFASLKTY